MRRPALLLTALALAACDIGDDGDEEILPPPATVTPADPIPLGTVPRGAGERRMLLTPPGPSPTTPMLARGEEAYAVFCTPCHGQAGYGDGPVTANGFPRPPSFHSERLRDMAPAHVVEVISDGYGLMYPMAERIAPEERWAIAHYVKALQQDPPATDGAARGGTAHQDGRDGRRNEP